ncbi:MAG: O-antigen ligase family protein, partial [Pseudonocardiaceae bacterium]
RLPRPVLAGAAVSALVLALAASAALHVPDVVAEKYRDFSSDSSRVGESGSSRLLSASDNGRREHWEVALDAFRRDRLRGGGAGSYQVAWMRDRQTPAEARDGHSLYIETLGELGLVGLAALAACLLLVLGGFARRTRGRDRTLFAALLAAGVAWALDAGVDWAWEMPAVTIWLFAFGGAALARGRSDPAPGQPSREAGRKTRTAQVALRVVGVAACVALAVLPARLAVSEARVDRSIERLHAGDCDGARAAAHAALDALDRRAVPHHVIGWCELRAGRFGAAARELSKALENDPHNWALRQASAVARAAAGLDPRRDARLAGALNPQDALAGGTRAALRRGARESFRRAGRRLAVALPEVGDR